MQTIKRFNLVLTIIPLLIFSLSYVTLLSTSFERARSQLLYFILGYFLFCLISLIDYQFYYAGTNYFLVLVYVLLGALFIIGKTVLGSARWLNIGGFNLQPSELAKLAAILYCASVIARKPNVFRNIKDLLKLVIPIIPLIALVLVQPDLGSAFVITFTFVFILIFSGLSYYYIVGGILALGISIEPLWYLLHDYQRNRILVFLNPSLDVLGRGYNVIQSLIAVGSGGLLGKGFGRGSQAQLNFLPVHWTDFIFASFSEEWGFVGVLMLLFFYILLLYSVVKIYYKANDKFGSVLALGALLNLFVQIFVNIGMNIGLLPVTGITLPLMSYGGSSMLVTFIMLGIVNSVWIHRRDVNMIY